MMNKLIILLLLLIKIPLFSQGEIGELFQNLSEFNISVGETYGEAVYDINSDQGLLLSIVNPNSSVRVIIEITGGTQSGTINRIPDDGSAFVYINSGSNPDVSQISVRVEGISLGTDVITTFDGSNEIDFGILVESNSLVTESVSSYISSNAPPNGIILETINKFKVQDDGFMIFVPVSGPGESDENIFYYLNGKRIESSVGFFEYSSNDILWLYGNTVGADYANSVENTSSYEGLVNVISAILPVELIEFDVFANQKFNKFWLNWATGLEYNNKGFNIFFSENGFNWRNIGFVNANQVYNISGSEYSYVFEEALDAYTSHVYFQLGQIDFDGSESLSNIVTVNNEYNGDNFDVFPNPLIDNHRLNVITSASSFSTLIYDSNGRTVYSCRDCANSINLNNLNPGIYTILFYNNRKYASKKIIIGN